MILLFFSSPQRLDCQMVLDEENSKFSHMLFAFWFLLTYRNIVCCYEKRREKNRSHNKTKFFPTLCVASFLLCQQSFSDCWEFVAVHGVHMEWARKILFYLLSLDFFHKIFIRFTSQSFCRDLGRPSPVFRRKESATLRPTDTRNHLIYIAGMSRKSCWLVWTIPDRHRGRERNALLLVYILIHIVGILVPLSPYFLCCACRPRKTCES